jgi:hypothetical protein
LLPRSDEQCGEATPKARKSSISASENIVLPAIRTPFLHLFDFGHGVVNQ